MPWTMVVRRCDLSSSHLGNSRGDVHGGTIAAIIDAAMSQAVRSLVDLEMGVATMTMNLNYLAPAKGEIICKGTVIKRGRNIMFTEAEVFGEGGNSHAVPAPPIAYCRKRHTTKKRNSDWRRTWKNPWTVTTCLALLAIA